MTKAETLKTLFGSLKNAEVLPLIEFTLESWQKNQESILQNICDQPWANQNLIVRSSSLSEDSEKNSLAGHFESILNVQGREALKKAIEDVFNSMTLERPGDQVFVQPMLKNVKRAGVLFTKNPANNTPYYVVNYDKTGSTSSVTSGSESKLKTFFVSKTTREFKEEWLEKLIQLAQELENRLENTSLDIEFAFDKSEKLYLFQSRTLVINIDEPHDLEKHRLILRQIKNKFSSLAKPFPYLAGDRSIFGLMPDWNPAEIIGVRPRALALSLYKELITDSIWAESRSRFGYRNLQGFPLLISLGGIPYIDVRVSFNSFIPKDINEELAHKLVNYYLSELRQNPNNHDKVEFEIILSCYTFDFDKKTQKLKNAGFVDAEINELKEKVRKLTNNIIDETKGLLKQDLESLEILKKRQEKILSSDLNEIEKSYWLIEDCKRYGTLAFAGLARSAFIAVQMLKSMIVEGILSDEDYHSFLNSLETVSGQMAKDYKSLNEFQFLSKYGHLRPGTYDIMSERYDEAPEKYFSFENSSETIIKEHSSFSLSLEKLNKLDLLLKEHQIDHNVVSLFNFFKVAIEGREYAKFLFTKNLSESMKSLETLGEKFNFSKEDVSFCDIEIIKRLYSSTNRFQPTMAWSIQLGKKTYYNITQNITLPPLICERSDIDQFALPENEPNFVTMRSTTAEVVHDLEQSCFDDKIVMIPNADPGFDWIFTKKIKGLITMFGGLNSHMAIRAQELGIPAVIGAGELLYQKWSKAGSLKIDCSNKTVQVVK